MQYGFVLPSGDALTAADFAHDAEGAGWDGFFVWEPVWGIDAWVCVCNAVYLCETPGASNTKKPGAKYPMVYARETWLEAEQKVSG